MSDSSVCLLSMGNERMKRASTSRDASLSECPLSSERMLNTNASTLCRHKWEIEGLLCHFTHSMISLSLRILSCSPDCLDPSKLPSTIASTSFDMSGLLLWWGVDGFMFAMPPLVLSKRSLKHISEPLLLRTSLATPSCSLTSAQSIISSSSSTISSTSA